MGDVIKDFYKSDAPQFRGRSKEKRREMAIAAKLTAERGPQNESATEKPMSAAELSLQKRKALIDKQITQKRQLALNKAQVEEELSIERRKRAAEIGAKSSSYKTRFAAMKLASGENKPVRGKGNKAAKRAAEVQEACWKTHEQRGMKKKGGKMVPNCVRKGSVSEATYPSDFRNPDGSKRSVAKKKTGRPIQHDQPTSGGRRKTVDESAEDRLRDQRMERGGVAGNVDYRRPAKNAATGSKKKYDGMSALAKVKAELEKKHGKGSVM